MKTRRIKNRHYINSKVNITILLLIILISTVFSIYSLGENNEANQISYSTYTILSGDTLWDVSTRYKNPSDDTRDFIEKIVEANQLTSLNVIPGQNYSFQSKVLSTKIKPYGFIFFHHSIQNSLLYLFLNFSFALNIIV